MLESKRLLLIEPDLSFNEALFKIHSNREATRYTPKRRHISLANTNNMLQDWINYWHENGFGYFVIVEKSTRKVIGSGGAEKMIFANKEYFNLYYRLHPNHSGKGYATEAMQAVIEWLDKLDSSIPLLIRTNKYNTASIKLATRLGFHTDPSFDNFEGTEDVFFF